MSEKLEEKYKYMCNMVEKMTTNIAVMKENRDREMREMEEIIAGAQKKEELLLDYIDNICGIIEAEMPLKEQDQWLEDCIKMGFYKREVN